MENKFRVNYAGISLFKYIFAILVLLLHAQQIFPTESWHFIQKSIFSRMAVPFFIICSSFLYRVKNEENGKGWKQFLWNLIKIYLLWSLIYLPYAFRYLQTTEIAPSFYLPAFLVALFYTGTCYHLWYFPAIVMGFLVLRFLKKYLPRKGIFFVLAALYLFGSMETYSAYLKDMNLFGLYERYQDIFFTSRNGLFYVPMFLYLGDIAYECRECRFLREKPFQKVIFSFLVFLTEASLIYMNQGIDKNFFLSLIPFSLFFFNWVWRSDFFSGKDGRKLRDLSYYYFFLHPLFIEFGFYALRNVALPLWQKGSAVAFFTLVCTHVFSLLILRIRKETRKYFPKNKKS